MLALAATATGGAAAPAPRARRTRTARPAAETLPRKDVPPLVKSVFEKDFQFCTDPELSR